MPASTRVKFSTEPSTSPSPSISTSAASIPIVSALPILLSVLPEVLAIAVESPVVLAAMELYSFTTSANTSPSPPISIMAPSTENTTGSPLTKTPSGPTSGSPTTPEPFMAGPAVPSSSPACSGLHVTRRSHDPHAPNQSHRRQHTPQHALRLPPTLGGVKQRAAHHLHRPR